MTASDKLREFAEKVAVKATWAGAIGLDKDWLVEPLAALISEGYVPKEDAGYPKEFLLWEAFNHDFECCKDLFTGKLEWHHIDEFGMSQVYTLDELYEYWKENER